MYSGEYIPPTLTVDSIIFQVTNGELEVLVVERGAEPFKGWCALPGGYNAAGETTHEAMARILERKAGVNTNDLNLIEQLYTFDTVARDPRGHAVSVTYMGLGRELTPHDGEHTQAPRFVPVSALPDLAYDHRNIIEYAHERLKAKLGYTNASYALLPSLFTLSQLQSVYEAVLMRPLDKRNFRKKFLSLELIEETDQMLREGAHRPARLYRFKDDGLRSLTRSFD